MNISHALASRSLLASDLACHNVSALSSSLWLGAFMALRRRAEWLRSARRDCCALDSVARQRFTDKPSGFHVLHKVC